MSRGSWRDNCDKCSMSQFILVHKAKIYYCDTGSKVKLKSHIETVHRDGDFNVISQ